MITDQGYRWIADDVYKVDGLKVKTPKAMGDEVGDDKFVILSQPQDMINGIQAMAVAPIKGYDSATKPIPDTSQVVIA
ncbi:hypothetical protein [Streptococcus suis]|uniref:hypothetical protein n=1 Tax=Streptococcus suis TaxID=1307 RepID=UPI000414AC54|nr:hypothetical protein [Streptococcus suis]